MSVICEVWSFIKCLNPQSTVCRKPNHGLSVLLPFTHPVVRSQESSASSLNKAIITSRPYPTDMCLYRTSYPLLAIQYQLLAVTIHIPYLRLDPVIDSTFCRRELEVVRH